jgi:hypothetical protein
MQVQRPSGGTNTNIVMALQVIESNNMYDLAGQAVTVSFWARAGNNFSASGSTLTAQVNTGTVADQGGSTYFSWTGVSANVVGSVTLTTSWQRFTVTGTFQSGALEAALLFYFTPTGTAGADDSFYITGVQLEKGSTATSFDYRPYTNELQLCQRYLETITYGSSTNYPFWGTYFSATTYGCVTTYHTTKRAVPTVTVVSGTWVGTTGIFAPGVDVLFTYTNASSNFYLFGTAGNLGVTIAAEL